MKHIITLSMLATAGILHAYPHDVHVKNNSGSPLLFDCYFFDSRNLPEAARKNSIQLSPQAIGHFGSATLNERQIQYDWEKITASTIIRFPNGTTAGKFPPVSTLPFGKDITAPVYLIYSDTGFTAVTEQEWNKISK